MDLSTLGQRWWYAQLVTILSPPGYSGRSNYHDNTMRCFPQRHRTSFRALDFVKTRGRPDFVVQVLVRAERLVDIASVHFHLCGDVVNPSHCGLAILWRIRLEATHTEKVDGAPVPLDSKYALSQRTLTPLRYRRMHRTESGIQFDEPDHRGGKNK